MRQYTCDICGKTQEQGTRGRKRRYCPGGCAKAAKQESRSQYRKSGGFDRTKVFKCDQCNATWCNVGARPAGRHGPVRFCSSTCSSQFHYDKRQGRKPNRTYRTVTCQTCHQAFVTNFHKEAKFCSNACRDARPRRVESFRSCKCCGGLMPIRATTNERRRQFCCRACGNFRCPPISTPTKQPQQLIECGWCGKKSDRKYCGRECQSFMKWYRQSVRKPKPGKHRRVVEWRVVYLRCPAPGCGGIKAARPSRQPRKSCDDVCEQAFREWQRNPESDNRGSGWISKRRRKLIYRRDGYRCQIAIRCDGGIVEDDMLSLDHIEHRSAGGTDESSNLRTACLPCNVYRSNKWLNDQLELFAA